MALTDKLSQLKNAVLHMHDDDMEGELDELKSHMRELQESSRSTRIQSQERQQSASSQDRSVRQTMQLPTDTATRALTHQELREEVYKEIDRQLRQMTEDVDARMDRIESQIEDTAQQLQEKIQEKTDNLLSNIETTVNTTETLKSRLSSVEEDVATLQETDVTEADPHTISQLQQKHEQITDMVQGTQEDVSQLRDTITTLQSEIKDARSFETIADAIFRMQEEQQPFATHHSVETLQDEFSQTKDTLASLQKHMQHLQQSMNTAATQDQLEQMVERKANREDIAEVRQLIKDTEQRHAELMAMLLDKIEG